MNQISLKFSQILSQENKEEAVKFILDQLRNQTIDVIELYTDVLTPALNNLQCEEERTICIWKEHVKTAIVRTIVECSYPYIIAKREEKQPGDRGVAVVLCPPEEYHELGARMVSDFLTVCGCNSIFVGGNTPYQDFYHAVHRIRPNIVAISVSDYYNLVATKHMIEELRLKLDYPVTIVVGGHAFNGRTEQASVVGADYFAQTFEDIEKIVKGGVNV